MTRSNQLAVDSRRAELVTLAGALRPELHRYCARLMGSVIEGEDIVQDAVARALAASEGLPQASMLRAWLFRIAHNRALDVIRSRAIRAAEPLEAAHEVADEIAPDPMQALLRREAVHTAITRFADLPLLQRSAIVLKDVLDESLADIAAMLGLSVDAVKAHLARGRARLREINAAAAGRPDAGLHAASEDVSRYAALFNRRDWDGLRALLASDVELHQSTYPIRTGSADVGAFFGIYAQIEGVWLVPAWLEDREVIAVFENSAAARPSYAMWLEWRDGQISFIRDYRYVGYVIADAELTLAGTLDGANHPG